ncbi:MAG: bifunctional phosphoribosyl-AMP cyclohydrolase/phosphoribosyl-ATP diphosphatase HisIE [Eubacteriales bacterium]|nr:bifunctional phosphoribosyl-AMP cyclohydrolase/phosphoribosyl-ATP diphosphatase HisIE [Eubacteriales bacterium]
MENIRLMARILENDDRKVLEEQAVYFDNCGADELFYYDAASFTGKKEVDCKAIQTICRSADIPLNVCGKVSRFEDVKKMIYAGAKRIIIKTEGQENLAAVKEAADRFGKERLYAWIESADKEAALLQGRKALEEGFGGIFLCGQAGDRVLAQMARYLKEDLAVPVYLMPGEDLSLAEALKLSAADGAVLAADDSQNYMELKQKLKEEGLKVNTFESAMEFEEFTLNSDGMLPVVTQDYKTGEVLMLAYMTKEAYEKTIATGKMTYYSRSRKELWTKGDTSGHYQYVKALSIDCDNDTLLAKVAQVGAACHTGNRSCFYRDLVRKEYDGRNPLAVFEDVFATILDRKEHPKEGSYTNYLFDKGIDKILKKVGEEATEIVIASKNPDSEELKYEICDFLYHMMVLMAERDVTWKDITDELAQRH